MSDIDNDSANRDGIFVLHGRALIKRRLDPGVPKGMKLPRTLTRKVMSSVSWVLALSLGIPFEILEGSNRTGGRLFTHRFDGGGPYDYYDVGAMRFPLPHTYEGGDYKPGVMWRLGQLFKYLGLQDKLERGGFKYFNGERARINEGSPNFNADKMGIDSALLNIGLRFEKPPSCLTYQKPPGH
ncbi:hypothetical protein B0H34DRAFT_812208 [Crassisporium funariophilum]|nr:hypothetical protein B0H34DRAFT_812208 [Crassisporium funariophilum]